jgi:hypothetical protein
VNVLSRREPEHGSEAQFRDAMQPQRSMGERPMQIDGRGDGGDLGEGEGRERSDPDVM